MKSNAKILAVPGMVAGMHRHFRALRKMKADMGWIEKLLEEAENERMHLMVIPLRFFLFVNSIRPG